MRIASDGQLFRCAACGQDKSPADFSFSDQARRLLNAYCRACHAAYRHRHYLANKPDYIRRAIAQVQAQRAQNRREVLSYLSTHPCVDCGIADAVVLEFDHRDPKQKVAHVGVLMNRRWARVRAEIAKCDVRCANCHRIRTADQFAWSKRRPSSRIDG